MFQFPGFAHLAVYYTFSIPGCPIQTSADQFLFADPRSFSQLITSFFASESQGIPHTPLFTSLNDFSSSASRRNGIFPMCSLVLKCTSLYIPLLLITTLSSACQ